jgi:hypothetical protein
MDILRFILPLLTHAEGASRHDYNVPRIPVDELPEFNSVFMAVEVSIGEVSRVWAFVLGQPKNGDQPIVLQAYEDRPARLSWMNVIPELCKQFDVEYVVGPANILFALRVWGLDTMLYTFEEWVGKAQEMMRQRG